MRPTLLTIARRALEGPCALARGETLLVAVSGGPAWKKQYNAAYVDCMTNRKPVAAQAPQPGYLPAVGTKQWKQMCSQKYKSFNWETGYYVGYDQQYHLCQLP